MFILNHRYGDTSPLPFDWPALPPSPGSGPAAAGNVRLVSTELQALDDRMLKDIGLQRYRIESAVLNGGRDEWYAPLADTGWPANR